MSRYGYGYLGKEDLVAFQEKFEKDAWAAHDIQAVRNPERKLPEKLEGLSLYQIAKLRVLYSIELLVETIGATSVVLSTADHEWDLQQKVLEHRLSGFELEGTPEEKSAAIILRERLLFEGGLGHIRFPAEQEAKYGKTQVTLARSKELSPYVAMLRLETVIDAIEARTTTLDHVSAEGDPRSVRIIKATAACALAINQVHGMLDGLLTNAPANLTQTLQLLLSPFEELVRTSKQRKPKEGAPAVQPPNPDTQTD